jgi:ketosteroid isomerase-like protein
VSEDRTDLVRRGYEAWNAGDRSWVLNHMTDEIVWVTPPEDPDASVYRGYLGVQRYWDEWREEVGDLRFEPLRFIGADDSVLVVVRRTGHGRSSGIDVSDEVIQVFDFEGERCYRVREFYDLQRARDSLPMARERA